MSGVRERDKMRRFWGRKAHGTRSALQARMKNFLFIVLAACGTKPLITNTEVTPANWRISGIADTATFTITTDVLHLGGSVSKVTATVEGKDLSFDLRKASDVTGGERWSVSTQLTLWRSISTGTYYLNITATDSNNTSVTETHAASVQVTD